MDLVAGRVVHDPLVIQLPKDHVAPARDECAHRLPRRPSGTVFRSLLGTRQARDPFDHRCHSTVRHAPAALVAEHVGQVRRYVSRDALLGRDLEEVIAHSRLHARTSLTRRCIRIEESIQEARNRSLLASIAFSTQRLSEEARGVLPYLAWFEGGTMELNLLNFTEVDTEAWEAIRIEAEKELAQL